MEKILIVRLGSMGDIIHALPAVRILRDTFPNTTIGWAIEENWAELLCAKGEQPDGALSPQKPLVDTLHLLNTKRWRKEMLASETHQRVAHLRRELRSQHYEVAIDFQGSLKSAVVTRLSEAKSRVGYEHPRESLAKLFYTSTVHPDSSAVHVIDQAIYLGLRAISAPETSRENPREAGKDLLPIDPAAESWCDSELGNRGLGNGRFAIMNPGAGWGAKQWPAERYGQVAKSLANEGIQILVNVGPSDKERQLGDAVSQSSTGTAEVVRCSLGQLIALTRRASLFIGGDTGPMHLAAALGVPVVALFGPTDPARNGPYYSPHMVLRDERSVTSYSHVSSADSGLLSIRPEEVAAATHGLLRQKFS